MKKLLISILVGSVLLGSVACTETTVIPGPSPNNGLEDTTWILESYGEPGNLQAVLEGAEVTLIFDSAEGRMRGNTGCNDYGGRYQVNQNELAIPEIAVTEQYCIEPAGIMEQEREYLNTFLGAETFQISDGKLRTTGGAQLLIFRAGEE